MSQGLLASEIRLTSGYGYCVLQQKCVLKIDGGTGIGSFTISGAFLGTTATDTGWEQAAKIEDALFKMATVEPVD